MSTTDLELTLRYLRRVVVHGIEQDELIRLVDKLELELQRRRREA